MSTVQTMKLFELRCEDSQRTTKIVLCQTDASCLDHEHLHTCLIHFMQEFALVTLPEISERCEAKIRSATDMLDTDALVIGENRTHTNPFNIWVLFLDAQQ